MTIAQPAPPTDGPPDGACDGRRDVQPAMLAAVVLVVLVAALVAGSVWVRQQAVGPPADGRAATDAAPAAPDAVAGLTDVEHGRWRRVDGGPSGGEVAGLFATGTGRGVLVLVEGAYDQTGPVRALRYDPGRDRWRPLGRSILTEGYGATAVWTGSRLLVLRGVNVKDSSRAAASYDLAADAWTPIPADPLPHGLGRATAFWTGRELLVWEIDHRLGAAFDPVRGRWRRLTRAFPLPVAARYRPATVWTGREVLVWGGCDSGGVRYHEQAVQCDDARGSGDELADGAAYDPATDTWRTIARSPLPARDRPVAVWTGTEMLVWGGVTPAAGGAGPYGAAYDPARDRWRVLTDAPIAPRSNHTAVWTGTLMLVWGGQSLDSGSEFHGDGAAYDPQRDHWATLPAAPVPTRDRHHAVWTGQELLIWGGCCQGDRYFASGAAFRPAP
jgi:hypothetical protein